MEPAPEENEDNLQAKNDAMKRFSLITEAFEGLEDDENSDSDDEIKDHIKKHKLDKLKKDNAMINIANADKEFQKSQTLTVSTEFGKESDERRISPITKSMRKYNKQHAEKTLQPIRLMTSDSEKLSSQTRNYKPSYKESAFCRKNISNDPNMKGISVTQQYKSEFAKRTLQEMERKASIVNRSKITNTSSPLIHNRIHKKSFSDILEKDEMFKIVDMEKTDEIYTEIRQTLKSHFLFYSLDELQMREIIDNLFFCYCDEGEYQFKQDKNGQSFFIVQEGEVDVIIDGVVRRSLGKGSYFGDLALIYNAPRSASILCKTRVGMWGITRELFQTLVRELKLKQYKVNRAALDLVKSFKYLNDGQKDFLASETNQCKYTDGEVLFSQGDEANSLFIINKGCVKVVRDQKYICNMLEGSTFGENAQVDLNLKTKRYASIIADGEVFCLSLGRRTLIEAYGKGLYHIIEKNKQRSLFNHHKVLQKFSDVEREKIMNLLETNSYDDGAVVFEKDKLYNKLFFLLNGEIKRVDGIEGEDITNTMFGIDYLINYKQFSFDCDYVASKNVRMATISFSKIKEMFGDDLETLFKHNEDQLMTFTKSKKKRPCTKNINFDSLSYMLLLGQGGFGTVHLVKDEAVNTDFALKSIPKRLITTESDAKMLIAEKEIQSYIDFAFIMTMSSYGKDDNYIHFLMEYIDGMPFDDVLMELEMLTDEQTVFYITQVIFMLEYLHNHHIIYRDLKPNNIICATTGYLKLIDLGCAKFLINNDRTFTVVGTPHYTAPEIISQKGYGVESDYWSLGIMLYEIQVGFLPFGPDEMDVFEVYKQILNGELEFPQWYDNQNGIDCVKMLLNKVPNARVGSGIATLKACDYFHNFDWNGLVAMTLEPPYKPQSKLIDHVYDSNDEIKTSVIQRIDECSLSIIGQRRQIFDRISENWDADF